MIILCILCTGIVWGNNNNNNNNPKDFNRLLCQKEAGEYCKEKVPCLSSSSATSLWCLLVAEPSTAPAGWEKGPFRPQRGKIKVT